MHLVGPLQFAGFHSVIDTMCGVSDKDSQLVADYTYQDLFRNGLRGCDPSESAIALNHAILSTITNCSSPICDCDRPDEIVVLSPYRKGCDIGGFSSSAGDFVAIFTGFGDVIRVLAAKS